MLGPRARSAVATTSKPRPAACWTASAQACALWGAALLLVGMLSARAHAQLVLSGQWRSGATAIDVAVESWGKDCGPQPTSSQSQGGGLVRVVQAGERLSLHSGNRVVHSDACFGQNPALRRKSKSVENNTWVTRCETPESDPRAESGTYTLKLLSPDRLLYQDISRFRWQLETSLCIATITTVQTLSRVVEGQPAPTPAPSATKAPVAPKLPQLPDTLATRTATAPACVPGPASRLSLTPRRARIELGARLCLRPRLFDAAGCALPSPTASFQLEHGKGLRGALDARGCFQASPQAAEGEGHFRVFATLQTADGRTLRGEASIDVVPADLSALVAKRLFEDDPDAGGFDDDAAPDGAEPAQASTKPSSQSAARAVGPAGAADNRPRWMWPALAFVLALLGVAIALTARRRVRVSLVPDASDDPSPAARAAAIASSASQEAGAATLVCPKCGTSYPAGSAFCGVDGSKLHAR